MSNGCDASTLGAQGTMLSARRRSVRGRPVSMGRARLDSHGHVAGPGLMSSGSIGGRGVAARAHAWTWT